MERKAAKVPDDGSQPRDHDSRVTWWLHEIDASKKREKEYRDQGQKVLDIYSGRKTETTPFNILFSNTETLLPALYSAVPRPVVQRRFKDEDPLGKQAAMAGQRVLEFLVDTNVEGYETFDEGVRGATLDALLPGRAVVCVKYDADVSEPEPETPYVSRELVCLDAKSWNRVYFGFARKWSKVPWIAYEEHIDRKEATRLFGAEMAERLQFTEDDDNDRGDLYGSRTDPMERDKGERKTACVYQIWDKDGDRKIRYVSPLYKDSYLVVQDDPLQLTGFFNCPRPLRFVEKSNDLLPVAMYALYENQAMELNRLTIRINRIVEAIKARGIYDGELGGDIGNLMQADDNALVPADKGASIAAEKGLQNAIWFIPLDALVNTLSQLYIAREQCKRVIYEITGISDIVRGSTVASETATAQEIKTQWGTLRLKRLQKEVQRYARDLLRMMLEVAATKFSEETWAQMTGLPFVPTQMREQLNMVAQAAQATGQPLDPQTQAALQAPVWGQVLEMLRNDMQRAYRVDIETNSTIEPEAAEDQKNISEMMNAIGQFLNGVAPLVQSGVMPFEISQSMLMAISRRFRFGNEIEDYIKGMKAPEPEGDDGEAAKKELQSQQQAMQKDAQAMQQKMQADQRVAQLEMQLKVEQETSQLADRENKLALREIKLQSDEAQFQADIKMANDKLGMREAVNTNKGQAEQKARALSETSAKREQQLAKREQELARMVGSDVLLALGEQVSQVVETAKDAVEQISGLQQQLVAIAQQQEVEQARQVTKLERMRGKDGRLAGVRRHHANGEMTEVSIQ